MDAATARSMTGWHEVLGCNQYNVLILARTFTVLCQYSHCNQAANSPLTPRQQPGNAGPTLQQARCASGVGCDLRQALAHVPKLASVRLRRCSAGHAQPRPHRKNKISDAPASHGTEYQASALPSGSG